MFITPFLPELPPDASGPHLSPLEALESFLDFFQTAGNNSDTP